MQPFRASTSKTTNNAAHANRRAGSEQQLEQVGSSLYHPKPRFCLFLERGNFLSKLLQNIRYTSASSQKPSWQPQQSSCKRIDHAYKKSFQAPSRSKASNSIFYVKTTKIERKPRLEVQPVVILWPTKQKFWMSSKIVVCGRQPSKPILEDNKS